MGIRSEEIHSTKPERVHPDKLFIPDISSLTMVELPKVIDLRDRESIIALLSQFVEEEQRRNPNYSGMFLHGSISHGNANNGSDIDAVHVVRESDRLEGWTMVWPIQYRLKGILDNCYRIPVQDNREVICILGPKDAIVHAANELDRDTIAIGLDTETIRTVQRATGYHTRQPYKDLRPHKRPSIEIGPHRFSFPHKGIFPWYIEYGLLVGVED